MINEYHLALSKFSKDILLQSDLKIKDNKLLFLNDNITVGPIINLNDKEGIAKREQFWKEELNLNCPINEDIKTYSILKKLLENGQKINIWLGHTIFEQLAFCKFLSQLKEYSSNINVLNLPKHKIQSVESHYYFPETIAISNPKDIKNLIQYFTVLSEGEYIKQRRKWTLLSNENTIIRTLKEGEIISVSEEYYDFGLIKKCTDNFTKAARIIGATMVDHWLNVSDDVLNWRLKKLAEEEKVDYKGELKNIKDYQVKLIN